MSIMKALQDYLLGCPDFFAAEGCLSFDRVDAVGDCGLVLQGEEVEAQYMDGSRRCRLSAVLHLRRATETDGEREENLALLERLARWITTQDAKGVYPQLGEERAVERLSCQEGRLIDYDETGASGIYQLALQMEYEQRG